MASSPPRRQDPPFAAAALALSMALVGANVPLAKYLTAHMPIVWIGLVRCAAATIALFALRAARRGPLTLARKDLLAGFAGLGLTGIFLYPCLLLLGLRHTGALAAGTIAATLPAIVALASVLILRERASLRLMAGVIAAVAAILLFNISSAGEATSAGALGNGLVLIAVFAEASYVLIARRVALLATPVGMALGANLAGLLAFFLLGIATGALAPPQAPLLAWLGAASFGLTSSVLALLLWFWGIARIEASRAGIFTVFLPLTAGLVAIVFLGERPTVFAIAALAFVIVAIVLTGEGTQRKSLPLP